MLSEGWAKRFAEEWIQAWNSHDLEQILFHYVEDFEMTTPFIAKSMNEPSGTIRGKRNVGAYWAKALAQVPDFQFELLEVLLGGGQHYHLLPGCVRGTRGRGPFLRRVQESSKGRGPLPRDLIAAPRNFWSRPPFHLPHYEVKSWKESTSEQTLYSIPCR